MFSISQLLLKRLLTERTWLPRYDLELLSLPYISKWPKFWQLYIMWYLGRKWLIGFYLNMQTMQYVLCTSLEKSPQTNPIIGRIECKAGHGAGRPTKKMVKDDLLILSAMHILFSVHFRFIYKPSCFEHLYTDRWSCREVWFYGQDVGSTLGGVGFDPS